MIRLKYKQTGANYIVYDPVTGIVEEVYKVVSFTDGYSVSTRHGYLNASALYISPASAHRAIDVELKRLGAQKEGE